MKKTLFSIALLLLTVLLVLQGCTTTGNGSATPTPVAAVDTGETVFTLDELLQFDGSNGQPAYIAVDGVVYDVTNVPQWQGGQHNSFTAGRDLTTEIKTISPHGVSKLVGLPVVGKLAD